MMLLFFATPIGSGFANYLIPLQVGAADMAFPRLNTLSYWLFLFGGLIVLLGLLHRRAARPRRAGRGTRRWRRDPYSPRPGMDLWIVGVRAGRHLQPHGGRQLHRRRSTAGGRPGMTMLRMPLFTWAILVTSTLILFAFPPLTAALAMLLIDRQLGGSFFDPAHRRRPDPVAAPVLVLRPPRGLHRRPAGLRDHLARSSRCSARKPMFGYRAMVLAIVAIAAPVDGRLGPPHVHDGRRVAAVLRGAVVAHRRPDRASRSSTGSRRCGAARSGSRSPMLWAIGLPLRLHDRRHHRRDGRLAADRLPGPGHVFRRRAHAQRADRRHGVRGVRRRSTSGSRR